MVKVHIHRTSDAKSNEVIHCPRCDRRNLVLKLGGKLVLGQRCSNCWYIFS